MDGLVKWIDGWVNVDREEERRGNEWMDGKEGKREYDNV